MMDVTSMLLGHASRRSRLGASAPKRDPRARLVELLEAADGGPVTIADLRGRGIEAPAQTVYELQLAGCPVDRVH